jgi:hypothetical protein
MIRFDRVQLAEVGGYAVAEVERENLTAAVLAVLAAIVEINVSGRLSFLDALCRKTRLPETVVKNAVRKHRFRGNSAAMIRFSLPTGGSAHG